jgi:hypothetical protein
MVENYNNNIGFVQIDARYTLATGFKHKQTGDITPFDGTDFKLITFLTQREAYFTNAKKSLYFESLDRICTAVTGKPHTDHGGNKTRIKKLINLGLLKVDMTKSGRIKNKGKKSVCKLDEVLKHYDLVNDALSLFDTPEATEQRKADKDQRLDTQKQREEERKQPCDGTESYFTQHPPEEVYQFALIEPKGYDDLEDANFGDLSEINIDDCPTYFMCDAELASYEKCLIVDEETEERENAAVFSFVKSCDEKPAQQPVVKQQSVKVLHSHNESESNDLKSEVLNLVQNSDVVADVDLSHATSISLPSANIKNYYINDADKSGIKSAIELMVKRDWWKDYSPMKSTLLDIKAIFEGKKQVFELPDDPMFAGIS